MSDLTVRELGPGDESTWRCLYSASAQHLGLMWNFCEVVAGGIGRAVRLGAFRRDQLIAGMVFVERRVRGFRVWRHPSPAPFAGLLHACGSASESYLRDVLAAFGAFIAASTPMAEVIFHSQLQDLRGLLWNGWGAQPRYNYVSEIAEEGALAKAAENSVRRQAAKARNARFLLHPLDHSPDLLIQLWDATRKRQGIPEWIPPANLRNLARMLPSPSSTDRPTPPCDGGLFGIGLSPQTIEAGMLFGADPQRVYYLIGAAALEEGEKGTGAPTLLHIAFTDEIFRRRGPFLYDWCGANTPSVAQFKKKFRPRLEVTMQAVWKAPWARFLL